MTITNHSPFPMTTPKKPTSKRKAARLAPKSRNRVESVFQGLQTTLQSRCAPMPKPLLHQQAAQAVSDAIEDHDADLKKYRGWWTFLERRSWPRHFDLPGAAGMHGFTPEDLIYLFARVLHDWEEELHALAARFGQKRPNNVAELAEVLAMAEQIISAEGIATDLDETLVGSLSPRLLLAALAKQQTIVKGPRQASGTLTQKGGR